MPPRTVEREHERALREITQALAANLDERRVLGMAVESSARLLGAPYARVWLFEEDGGLSCAAAEGYVHSDTFTHRLAHDSISGQAARQRIVNREDAPHEAGWFFNREFGEQTGLGAYLGAGLWRAGEPLGVLEVMRAAGRRFTLAEEQLLVTLANAVAVAVSNARTHAEVEALAHEAERRAAEAASSELLLRTVYEAIGSGVMVFDASGAIVNANAAAAEITGRPVEQLLGMHSTDFLATVREDGSPLPDGERAVVTALRTRQPVRKFVFGITRPDRSGAGCKWTLCRCSAPMARSPAWCRASSILPTANAQKRRCINATPSSSRSRSPPNGCCARTTGRTVSTPC